MKLTSCLGAFAASLLIIACSPSRSTTTVTTQATETESAALSGDRIEYYETEYEVRQKDYLAQLSGDWNISSMQRQAMMPVEDLSNISLRLNADKTFEAGLSCGNVTGTYSLKGTSIKFYTEGNTECSSNSQMSDLVKLLTQTVSAYTVDNKTLLLRDGSSNIVFRASKVY